VRLRTSLTRPAAIAAGALVFVVAACGGAAPAPAQTDAYTLASDSFDANWDQVKLNIGLTTTGTDSDISVKPENIQIALDTKAGKGAFHLSLPKSALGSEADSLAQFGVTGDTLDVDVLFDGQGLYAKSPVAATLLPMLMAQTGTPLTGDLSGWIKLGTKDEFAALAGSLGGALPIPSASANPAGDLSALDAAALKQKLDQAGVTLTVVGTEQRNGVNATHLTINVDPAKFAASDFAKEIPTDQLKSFTDVADAGTLSADVWVDSSNKRLSELDLHVADKSGEKGEFTVLVSSPDASAFATPDGATEVPIAPLIQQMAPLLGAGLMGG
jgi:hypothetical protein